jgi:hypothetical protein
MTETNIIQFIPAEEYEQEMREMGETLSQLAEDGRANVVIPRAVGRKRVVNAFMEAFEMVGGVSRLSYWAHENYGEFIKLHAKLLPGSSQKLLDDTEERVIKHVIPPTNLDS